MVWGYDRISEWLNNRLTQGLDGTPQENIITPPIEIAGPTIEALRYTDENSGVRELYANLLATSMNKETAYKAHPAYVGIITNLTPDEALILKSFVTESAFAYIDIRSKYPNGSFELRYSCFCSFHNNSNINTDLIATYIDNLCRLGLLIKQIDLTLDDKKLYESLIEDPLLSPLKKRIIDSGNTVTYKKSYLQLTAFGKQFVQNIVKNA